MSVGKSGETMRAAARRMRERGVGSLAIDAVLDLPSGEVATIGRLLSHRTSKV